MKKEDLTVGQRRWFNFLSLTPPCALISAMLLGMWEDYWGGSYFGKEALIASLFLMIVQSGLMLWYLRENGRAVYGALELMFALLFIYFTIFVQFRTKLSEDLPDNVTILAQLGGCIYVFVRGMDNFNQGIREYPRVMRRWNWLALAKIEKPKPDPEYPWTRKT